MPRNIIICLDGTNNEIGDFQTHIVRLFRGLSLTDTQIPYYAQGIGTVNSQDLNEPEPEGERARGMAFGEGLEAIVLDAYRFLCTTYDFEAESDAATRDKLYFIGFSRGAYAARMLAGFIHNFGLLRPTNLHMAVHIFREYLQLIDVPETVPDAEKYLTLRRYERVFDPEVVPIEGLILFDTVSSMIRFPGLRHPVQITRPKRSWRNIKQNWAEFRDNFQKTRSIIQLASHPSTSVNASVRFVLHALAVDERRTFFRPLLWKERHDQSELDDLKTTWTDKPWRERDATQLYFGNRFKSGDPEQQIVRQVWFPGVHGDVGGSAREDEAGLGKITACWVYDQLEELKKKQKIDVDFQWRRGFHKRYLTATSDSEKHQKSEDGRPISGPDPTAPIHDQLKLGKKWRLPEWVPKSVRRREPPEDGKGYYLPRGERRYIAPGSLVHPSVFDRRDADPDYDPPALKGKSREDFPTDDPALYNPSYPAPASDG